MPLLLNCSRGHSWHAPDSGNGLLPAGQQRCPVCGAPVTNPPRAGVDRTLSLGAVSASAAPRSPGSARAMPPEDTVAGSPEPAGDTPTRPAPAGPALDPTLQKSVSVTGKRRAALDRSEEDHGYEILEVLGRGGMGVVYKARQKRLNRLVALKMILAGAHASPEDRLRFKIEAEAVAQLQHPNIVQIYEVGERDGHPFFSLEYIEGGTLADRLAQTGGQPADFRWSVDLIRQLAGAMHYAHQRGIVHRDLKPANILLAVASCQLPVAGKRTASSALATDNRQLATIPKITDFGLAKRLDAATLQDSASGSIVGTPSYMAPEQAAGHSRSIGPATDIYALGSILYELLTGRPPFRGASTMDTMMQVMQAEPLPPRRLNRKVPLDLETICLKCLHKQPARRYASAGELAEDLRRFLAHEPIHARPVAAWERGAKWTRRHPSRAVLAALTFLLVVGGFALVVQRWRQAETARRAEVEQKKQSRLHDAQMFIRFMGEVRRRYAEDVVAKVRPAGIEVAHDYRDRPKAIPIWATLAIELSQGMTNKERGEVVRLYSDHPFPWRKDGGPWDDFEGAALVELRKQPTEPYYRFEEYQGRSSLRYAAADRMLAACVSCHNSHPDSPKTDWQIGDVRGVLEIVLPVE